VVCEPLGEDPIYAQVDGEPLGRLPVEFRIMPRALKLLVPGNGLPTGSKAAAKP
jgi:diacylglycerol kinase family enzyme